jgi:predicted nuclease of predicted toxin-antitoxin system
VIKLLLDMGLPRRTAEDLTSAGWDAEHVAARGRARASDDEIVAWGREEGRTIVTLDADFARVLAMAGARTPSLLWLRIEGLDRKRATELLQRLLPELVVDLEAGCVVSVTDAAVRVRRMPLR